jgi:hypothetical protein
VASPIVLLSTTLLDEFIPVVPLDEFLDELFLQDEIVKLKNKISKMFKILLTFFLH